MKSTTQFVAIGSLLSVLGGCSSAKTVRTQAATSPATHDSAATATSTVAVAGSAANSSSIPAGSAGMAAASGKDAGTPQTCKVGATRACCGSGVQTCAGVEFVSWGACLDSAGKPLECGCRSPESENPCDAGQVPMDAGETPHDAGTARDAGRECGPNMDCKPGSIRYCDESSVAEWTLSTCSAAGKWSACVATTIPAKLDGVGDCSAMSYSPESCCLQQQLCCQDGLGALFDPFGSTACNALKCP